MAWFLNYYQCSRCDAEWANRWSCMADDDCANCSERHISPYDSEDLTEVVRELRGLFVVFRSPRTAEHRPDYKPVMHFPTRELAEAYVSEDVVQRACFFLLV